VQNSQCWLQAGQGFSPPRSCSVGSGLHHGREMTEVGQEVFRALVSAGAQDTGQWVEPTASLQDQGLGSRGRVDTSAGGWGGQQGEAVIPGNLTRWRWKVPWPPAALRAPNPPLWCTKSFQIVGALASSIPATCYCPPALCPCSHTQLCDRDSWKSTRLSSQHKNASPLGQKGPSIFNYCKPTWCQ
jgi:hypothetical protein